MKRAAAQSIAAAKAIAVWHSRVMAAVSAEDPRYVKVKLATGHTTVSAPLVVHVFPTFAVGGAQVRFAAIANHFGRAFRHIVVSLDGNLACRERLQRGSRCDVSRRRREPRTRCCRTPGGSARLLRDWRPDVLVTCNWGAIEFALANIVPVTRHLHVVDGFGPEERAIQIPRRVLMRRFALSRTPVVLPSRNLVRIATEVWKLPPNAHPLRAERHRPGSFRHGRDATRAAPNR